MKARNLMSSTLTILLTLATLVACAKRESSEGAFVLKGSASAQTESAKLFNGILDFLGPKSAMAVATLGSPTEVRLNFYSVYLSENEDCSNPIIVQDYGNLPVQKNLSTGETLFEGNPPAGEYKCMILKMQDIVSFKPDAVAQAAWPGVCSEGLHAFDIYRASSDDIPWIDIEGNDIVGHGEDEAPVADVVYIYATTNLAALGNESENQSLELTSGLTLPSTQTFYVDFTDGVSGMGNKCNLEKSESMGFR
jgi:hypothetical protein